jgi:hypothetical protein
MKKTGKHRFVHFDPERTPTSFDNGTEKSTDRSVSQNPQDKVTAKDLKRVGVSIAIFILIIAAFYLLNDQYNILEYFNSLLAL